MLIISDSYRLFLLSITTYRNLGQARNQSSHKCARSEFILLAVFVRFWKILGIPDSFQYVLDPPSPNTKFKNNLLAGAEFFHTDVCPDMTKKIASFHTFAKATGMFCESEKKESRLITHIG